jgi:NADPH-dependent ferric siderophore reductase
LVALPADTAAYVHGERRLVRHAVELLVARGVVAGAIASKAYWRHDQANKAHGEPAKE